MRNRGGDTKVEEVLSDMLLRSSIDAAVLDLFAVFGKVEGFRSDREVCGGLD